MLCANCHAEIHGGVRILPLHASPEHSTIAAS
jgi:predicted HNH restriction endonuclease